MYIHTYSIYSEVPIIRPPGVLVGSGLNSEQVSLRRPIYIEKYILVMKQVILLARVVLIFQAVLITELHCK